MVLAVDPSLRGTGYAWRGADGVVVTGTLIQKEGKGMRRLDRIAEHILSQADGSGATLAVFEGYAFAPFRGGATRSHSLGEIGGILKYALWSRGLNLLIVPPSCLKNFMLGPYQTVRVNAAGKKVKIKVKDLVKEAAEAHAGRAFSTNDQSDAYGLLLMGEGRLDSRNLPRLKTHYKRTALAGCEFILGKNRRPAAVCN